MRTEFSAKIKAAAALRANGQCDGCGRKLLAGDWHYDHTIADAIGGEATLSNCAVLCKSCHSLKTRIEDMPRIAKTKRNFRKAVGIKKERQIRAWRKFDGTPVFADKKR